MTIKPVFDNDDDNLVLLELELNNEYSSLETLNPLDILDVEEEIAMSSLNTRQA